MAEINWGLLQTPDFVGNALSSYDAGQRQRNVTGKRNALAMYGKDPQGSIDALRQYDPEMAAGMEDRQQVKADRLRADQDRQTRKDVLGKAATDLKGATQDAYASGDTDLINAVGKLSTEQRALKAQQTDEVSAVAFALRQSPYEARKAAMSQLTPYLTERGFTPEQVAGFDPTDANLDTVIAQGASLKELLQNAREDRQDRENSRRQAETERHNQRMEEIGLKNAGANVTRANKAGSSRSSGSGLSSMSTEQLVAALKGAK